MNNRKQLLEKLKEQLPSHLYDIVLRILDMNEVEDDKLTLLSKRAEINCLKACEFKHNLPDYLEPKDRVEYMELDNAERIKFGLEPEWSLEFIESVRKEIK